MGPHPKNIVFLTCDAMGVLPPLSRLTYEQGAYQFLTGYTAKLAGTEISVKEPQATFSACFGEIFIPLHPSVYVDMFYSKIRKHECRLWLLNTGWVRGKYGQGQRIDIQDSLRMLDAIFSGELDQAETYAFKYFGFQVPRQIAGVDPALMQPADTWESRDNYEETLRGLVKQFLENGKKYADKVAPEIMQAGPKLD